MYLVPVAGKHCQEISLKVEDTPVSCDIRPANKDTLKEVSHSDTANKDTQKEVSHSDTANKDTLKEVSHSHTANKYTLKEVNDKTH